MCLCRRRTSKHGTCHVVAVTRVAYALPKPEPTAPKAPLLDRRRSHRRRSVCSDAMFHVTIGEIAGLLRMAATPVKRTACDRVSLFQSLHVLCRPPTNSASPLTEPLLHTKPATPVAVLFQNGVSRMPSYMSSVVVISRRRRHPDAPLPLSSQRHPLPSWSPSRSTDQSTAWPRPSPRRCRIRHRNRTEACVYLRAVVEPFMVDDSRLHRSRRRHATIACHNLIRRRRHVNVSCGGNVLRCRPCIQPCPDLRLPALAAQPAPTGVQRFLTKLLLHRPPHKGLHERVEPA